MLENLVDTADDAICDPSGSKTVFSSGSPIVVTSFRQNGAGPNKIQFSFDIVHSGSGDVFEDDEATPHTNCSKTPTDRRKKEDNGKVSVKTGIGTSTQVKCVGLTTS